MEGYKGYSNFKCKFFPCHEVNNVETFNCMFCYCPLYLLKEDCGGDFVYLKNRIKDCSHCIKTHGENSYEFVQSKMKEVIEKAKKGN
ncbi:metal-binding protein [Candidatus Epulonipiscium fishelsonii]|uniref:Metal-binding protein n=1 Tax=Candidatus Epulonipiscium fishelsonii TaxID=77094 RepID=A0ACC8XGL9_9FIRM|nr:metal-binding protein [Epulopiscium sp. SCG-B05WGA-EpuloA1]ONI42700.1 metal-binding protein [Epulopiscium sp. SCG-B11WGA-EpuloA1]